MTNAEPRFRRMDADERRRLILASAVRHFGEKPYAEVSVAEVAADAGAVRSLVNHYFGDKRDLYLAVVRSMLFVPARDALPEVEGDLEHRIAAVVDWLMDVIDANGPAWIRAVTPGGVGPDPEVQQLLDEADDRAAALLLDIVGYRGRGAARTEALASIRVFGGMVKAMAREVVERRTLSSERARRVLTHALGEVVGLLEE